MSKLLTPYGDERHAGLVAKVADVAKARPLMPYGSHQYAKSVAKVADVAKAR